MRRQAGVEYQPSRRVKPPIHRRRLCGRSHCFQKSGPWYRCCTERSEVGGFLLTVDQWHGLAQRQGNQGSQRDFRAVRFECEHRLTKYRASNVDCVEPPDQLAVPVRRDRMNISFAVERTVGLNHWRNNPRAILPRPLLRGAVVDDLIEIGVHADLKRPLAQAVLNTLSQATVQFERRGF